MLINHRGVFMKARPIKFWHGGYPDKIVDKLESMPNEVITKVSQMVQNHKKRYMFDFYWLGTLDEFEKLYNDKFIIWGGDIWVTQHSNFGQR